ncbi:MAG: L-histidine N(alpha)-methyltransferase [Chloroflexota bacterium]
MDGSGDKPQLHDRQPDRQRFLIDVLNGLRKPQKELPSKYFYDARGSHLFECITRLPQYYIPRAEEAIMRHHAAEMASLLGPNILLVEPGCGECLKTRLLLDHLRDPAAYVPIDISREQLLRVSADLASSYPRLEVLPVCADYTDDYELPRPSRTARRVVVFFPGSTIGNFEPPQATQFLKSMARLCGPGGALLLGIDLKKDPALLHSAYNDPDGITAAFNLNLLQRINGELGADFQLDDFRHYAFYNPSAGRVEMHLVSLRHQTVHLNGEHMSFARGESIWTESSYKYDGRDLERLAGAAGFRLERIWTDGEHQFSVQCLARSGGSMPSS